MSRFDYVKYDERSDGNQADFKIAMQTLESMIVDRISCGRSKALALTALEECYMWTGKGIRNDQIARNHGAILQEERKNS